MDGIDQINGAQGVQFPMNQKPKDSQDSQEPGHRPYPDAFNVLITQLGQLFFAVEELGESAKYELKQFHENLFEALQNGNFSAEELAENASDEIKIIAEEAGIDLVAALTEFKEHAQQLKEGPPPGGKPMHGPPPPPDESDDEEYSGIYSDSEN